MYLILLNVFAWLVMYLSLFLPGVTDFKAVKDSSTSDLSPPPSINLLVITASAGGFFVFCILALCIIFTYRRKVGALYDGTFEQLYHIILLREKLFLSLNFIKWKLP